jgi:hypothetical protein
VDLFLGAICSDVPPRSEPIESNMEIAVHVSHCLHDGVLKYAANVYMR